MDSLNTTLNFLQSTGSVNLSSQPIVQSSLDRFKSLQGKLNASDQIRKALDQRRRLLQEQLQKLGIVKAFKGFKKQVYYYQQQLLEYKSLFDDPSKLEAKLTQLVLQIPLFQQFFANNSQLGNLFALPGSTNATASLAGLQTRAMVQQGLIDRFGAAALSPSGAVGSGLQNAQSQLNQLKDKVMKFGGSSSDDILPEGFKPNEQKTKSFLKRLEYGANVQSQKATNFFPVTSDLGLSLGYKLNDKSVIGIGASYKMGWGKGWNNINITHQGVGFRSFVDIKLKGSFWISGGYEKNYKSAFKDFSQLQDRSGWQTSGLIGISKVVSLKTKIFKKTKLQLLWDFMSYQQIPRTQPVVFRIGYNF